MIPNCQHSEDFTKIAAALVSALPKIEAASKDSANPAFRSKYADLTSVMEVAKGPLAESKIVILQPPASTEDNAAVVSTVLLHESGQWIGCTLTLRPTQNTPQAVGSAITYARRYSLSGLLGITAEDDDGNAASGTGSAKAAQDVAQRRIADLKKPQPVATPKPAGAVTEDLLKAYLRRASKNQNEAQAVYAELGTLLEKAGGQDFADQCWNNAIREADPVEAVNEVVTLLYRALKGAQEPAA